MKLKDKDLSLLGKFSDNELALRWGVCRHTVYFTRRKMSIPPCPPKRAGRKPKITQHLEILGVLTDKQASRVLGVCEPTVARTRRRFNINPSRKWRKIDLSKVDWNKRGAELAREFGVAQSTIARARRRHGKPTLEEAP